MKREHNEDSLPRQRRDLACFVVCDGMVAMRVRDRQPPGAVADHSKKS